MNISKYFLILGYALFINVPYILWMLMIEEKTSFFGLNILINVLLTLLVFFLPFVNSRWFFILLSPWYFMAILLLNYLLNYNNIISKNALAMLFIMNKNEMLNFIQFAIYDNMFWFLLSILIMVGLILIKPLKPAKKPLCIFIILSCSLMSFILKNVLNKKIENVDTSFMDTNIFYYPAKLYLEADLEGEKWRDEKRALDETSHRFFKRYSKDDSFLHILILGGEQNRNHWSLYGYHKTTNPYLESRDDLLVFKRMLAVSLDSKNNLEYSLKLNIANQVASIFKVIHEAGIYVASISNRPLFGDLKITGLIDLYADKKIILNHDLGNISYDNKVVESLKNELVLINKGHPKALIILNLLGSKQPFKRRYPKDFGQYPDEKNLVENQYLNLIQFHDQIINNVINLIKEENKNSLIVYVSNPLEDEIINVEEEKKYEIPFLIWASPQYQQNSDILYSKMISSLEKPLSMMDFSQSFLEMIRIEVDKISFFSKIDRSYRAIEDTKGRLKKIQ